MGAVSNAILGIAFLVVGAAATFLMYHLWGYSFDHEKMKSEAPPFWMRVHRILGWIYVAIYIYFMTQMVPRLWQYQIELPARTVVHLTLGMGIGAILIVKILIVRFFKHLEAKLVPALGTSLFIATCLLIGLSAPFALRQTYLARQTSSESEGVYSTQNRVRVRDLLQGIGLQEEALLDEYSAPQSLRAGSLVLTNKCVRCHDLRTALLRPRVAKSWRSIVSRMADRSVTLDPITIEEEWKVTAYLIAISPHLQKARRQEKKQEKQQKSAVARCKMSLEKIGPTTDAPFDRQLAKQLVQKKCTQCHGLDHIEDSPPRSLDAAKQLVGRMIDEGFTASDNEILLIVRFLAEKYGKQTSK